MSGAQGALKHAVSVVCGQLSIDRVTPPIDVTSGPSWERSTLRAGLWVGVAYVLGFGASTWLAIRILVGTHPLSHASVDGTVFGLMIDIAALTCAGLAYLWYLRDSRQRGRQRPSTGQYLATSAKVVPMAILASWIGARCVGAVTTLTGWDHFPKQDYSAVPIALTLVVMLMAGPVEELVIVALPALALRSAGVAWWVVFTLSILMRVPFHLYYGWPALAYGVWAGLSVALYRRTGSVLGLIVAHSLWNALTLTDPTTNRVVIYVLIAAAVTVVVVTLVRASRAPHNETHASVTS